MKFLAIDYGTKHIGLAIASSPLAEPHSQLFNDENMIANLKRVCETEKIDKIVVGISEGEMLSMTHAFIRLLKKHFDQEIIDHDETLSSVMASQYLVESGAPKKKRQEKDHQVAAAIILQSYLDENPTKIYE